MKSHEEIETLEKLIGRLNATHTEISQLAKKSPSDSVNKFKLKYINQVITSGNDILGDKYKPLAGFDFFEDDDIPSNSDVTMVLSQYLEEAERYRSASIVQSFNSYYYVINGEKSEVRAAPPSWSKKK